MLSRIPTVVWTSIGGGVVGLLLFMRYATTVPAITGLVLGLVVGGFVGLVILFLKQGSRRQAEAMQERFPGAVVVSTRNDSTSARGLGQLLPWAESNSVLDPTPLVVFDKVGIGLWSGPKKEARAFFIPWTDVTTFKVGAKGEGNILDKSPRQLLEFAATKGDRDAKVAIPVVVAGSKFLDEAGVRALVAEVKAMRAS